MTYTLKNITMIMRCRKLNDVKFSLPNDVQRLELNNCLKPYYFFSIKERGFSRI